MTRAAGATAPTADEVSKVAGQRIFFGHQSVGQNVLDGLADVTQGRVRIVESRDPSTLDTPGLAHTQVGHNEDPRSKIADFEKAMDSMGPRVDVAFFKFCYVDFEASTDAGALATEVKAALDRLQAKFPRVTFVAVTTPLTTVQSGAKAWLKGLLGKPLWGQRENVARQAFNEALRTQWKGPVFDLARAEAVRPDGTTQSFTLDGATVPALVPDYSDDGGHLNATGRRMVAEALVHFLAALPSPKSETP